MLWEELTAREFLEAVKISKGTCLLPIGVVEKHGQHLPLGTDMYMGRWLGEAIARIEPAVVFPYYFFGQIAEARHVPGTVSLSPSLQFSLLDEVCNEISRNGLKKVVLLDCHGGNKEFLNYFIQSTLYSKKDYAVYNVRLLPTPEGLKEIEKMLGTDDLGPHGGNSETSRIMAIRPDLVKMDRVIPEEFTAQEKLKHLKDTVTAMNWYADYPTHFAGDPSRASEAVGQRMLELVVDKVAGIVKVIKEDQVTAELLEEFYSKCV
jgi:creatinine amidohydrolase